MNFFKPTRIYWILNLDKTGWTLMVDFGGLFEYILHKDPA